VYLDRSQWEVYRNKHPNAVLFVPWATTASLAWSDESKALSPHVSQTDFESLWNELAELKAKTVPSNNCILVGIVCSVCVIGVACIIYHAVHQQDWIPLWNVALTTWNAKHKTMRATFIFCQSARESSCWLAFEPVAPSEAFSSVQPSAPILNAVGNGPTNGAGSTLEGGTTSQGGETGGRQDVLFCPSCGTARLKLPDNAGLAKFCGKCQLDYARL